MGVGEIINTGITKSSYGTAAINEKGSEGTSELDLLMEFITSSPTWPHIYGSNPYLDMEAKCTSTHSPSFQGNYGGTYLLHVQV
ncbi:hypothetical protein VNO78_04737 [Psophocarpus tetragonolobus]|uniref:Uncharacterized protein n=1 Tax=Psophocarpus tetragonolobus TaxID=3891 RepID=A0AAN9XWF7_PSOTE